MVKNTAHWKAEQSLDLIKNYFGAEIALVRTVVWNEVYKGHWDKGDRNKKGIIKYFWGYEVTEDLPVTKAGAHSLTPMQCTYILISFWDRLAILDECRMLDYRLIRPLKHEYLAWEKFFSGLTTEMKKNTPGRSNAVKQPPGWVEGLSRLPQVFSKTI